MSDIEYREANEKDVAAMAAIRSLEWGTEDYWNKRILGYMNGKLHPQQALLPRIFYVTITNDTIIGFIAGHLTRRFDCDGEIQWINVQHEYKGKGLATKLLGLLAAWFTDKDALRICVDVDPDNPIAQNFYTKHGAEKLNNHWLYWKDISESF